MAWPGDGCGEKQNTGGKLPTKVRYCMCRCCDYGRILDYASFVYCDNRESKFYKKLLSLDFACEKWAED